MVAVMVYQVGHFMQSIAMFQLLLTINLYTIAPEREEHYMLLIVFSVLLKAFTVTIELVMVGL